MAVAGAFVFQKYILFFEVCGKCRMAELFGWVGDLLFTKQQLKAAAEEKLDVAFMTKFFLLRNHCGKRRKYQLPKFSFSNKGFKVLLFRGM